jgi:hypothetical protein
MATLTRNQQQTLLVKQLLRTPNGRRKLAVGLENAIQRRLASGTLTEENILHAVARLKEFGWALKMVKNG